MLIKVLNKSFQDRQQDREKIGMSQLIESANTVDELNKRALEEYSLFRETTKTQLQPNSLAKLITNLRFNQGQNTEILKSLKNVEEAMKEIEVFRNDIFCSGSNALIYDYIFHASTCEKIVDSINKRIENDISLKDFNIMYFERLINQMESYLIKVIKSTQKHVVVVESNLKVESCKMILSSVQSYNQTNNTIAYFNPYQVDIITCTSLLTKYQQVPTLYILGNIEQKERLVDSLFLYLKDNPNTKAQVIIQGDQEDYMQFLMGVDNLQFQKYFTFDKQIISAIARKYTKPLHQLVFLPHSRLQYFSKHFDFYGEYENMNNHDLEKILKQKKNDLNTLIKLSFISDQKKKETLTYFIDFVGSLVEEPQQISENILCKFLERSDFFYKLMLSSEEEEFKAWKEIFKLVTLSFLIYNDEMYEEVKSEYVNTLFYSAATISDEDLKWYNKYNTLTQMPTFAPYYKDKEIAKKTFSNSKEPNKINLLITTFSHLSMKVEEKKYKCIKNKVDKQFKCYSLPFKLHRIISIKYDKVSDYYQMIVT